MATTLVVPGVRVEARFDVLPPPPAAAGILGAVGIVDRPPADGRLVGVSKVAELRSLLGPGTQVTMPEVVHALANGASEAVISAATGGNPAAATLLNITGEEAVTLRCRSNGAWGNELRAEVRGIANASGNIVRVSLHLLRGSELVESFSDLRVAPGEQDNLFDVINQGSRYVVAMDPGLESDLPQATTYVFDAIGSPIPVPIAGEPANVLFQLLPADGVSPDGLSVQITVDGSDVDVQVFQGGLQERFSDLNMDNPDSESYLPYVLLTQSRFIRVEVQSSLAAAGVDPLPAATSAPVQFDNGSSPGVDSYREAINLLAEDPRIDLIVAAIEPNRDAGEVHAIHQALVAHAVTMADNGAPRVAFGSVTAAAQANMGDIRDHAAAVRSRRFVLVSPAGAAGAVAGLVARLSPHESPTFKPTPLHGMQPATYRESQLNRLLGPSVNLCVVQDRAGRGVVVLRGIDTTGDQISVTRVADQAIREVKAHAEGYIGRLNTEDARIALKQQIIATFTRMERANALVPSADGSDPAFIVDVYSTNQDFAQGIVRIDIAVRPVRAIDYVYATIRVKN